MKMTYRFLLLLVFYVIALSGLMHAESSLYTSSASSEGDFESLTANTLIVTGIISALPSSGQFPTRIEDLTPLYIHHRFMVTNQLMAPYSTTSFAQMNRYISFDYAKILLSFDDYNSSGGLFFHDSLSGLVFNSETFHSTYNVVAQPMSLRSRGNIYLQPRHAHTTLGTTTSPNWSFADNSQGTAGNVSVLAKNIFMPEMQIKNSQYKLSEQLVQSGNNSQRNFVVQIPSGSNNGFIFENDAQQRLLSVKADTGDVYIKGNLDVIRQSFETIDPTMGNFYNDTESIFPTGIVIGFVGNNPPPKEIWAPCNSDSGFGAPDIANSANSDGVFIRAAYVNCNYPFYFGGRLAHKHSFRYPHLTVSLDHDHPAVRGYAPTATFQGGSTLGIFNSGTDAGDRPLSRFNFDGDVLGINTSTPVSSPSANWIATPILHVHLIGAANRGITYDYPMWRYSMLTSRNQASPRPFLDTSDTADNSGGESEYPPFAKVVLLMKT